MKFSESSSTTNSLSFSVFMKEDSDLIKSYEIEKIVSKRLNKKRDIKYFVRWLKYNFEENIWRNLLEFDNVMIDWFIYSFVVLTSNMSISCGSIYWCLYRKTVREKNPISFVFHRLRFETLSKLFRRILTWCFFYSLICHILIWSFNDHCLIRNKNVRELM